MKHILETTADMVGTEYDFIDIYDLLTFEVGKARIDGKRITTVYDLISDIKIER